ncbi:MAG: DNA-binding protein [Chitinophagales bacterium]|nr:DNA-binding protein [Chitinophagales bacterium]
MKDLTNSQTERKNILNNNIALQELYEQLGFRALKFEAKYRYTKQQISRFFEVDTRTIERLLENHAAELAENGYELFSGKRLREFRNAVLTYLKEYRRNVSDVDVGDISEMIGIDDISSKTPYIGIFTFRAFLNIGMLLTGSERARELRSAILDIVIDVLNKKMGGSTKYINQREEEFLPSAIREFNYRQEFTDALNKYIEPNNFKYAQLTDKIYLSIFKENAREYRQILNLNSKENVRLTMYSEVLDLISSYENGFAAYLKKKFESIGRKLELIEAHELFNEFENLTIEIYEPLREKARSLMASRDMALRDALHEKLKSYIGIVSSEDFEKFIGEHSISLEERIEENKEVFKRLKGR